MKLLLLCSFASLLAIAWSIPVTLIYDYRVPEAVQLPKEDDVSTPEIKLKVPINYFGQKFDSIFVNSNGILSFQTEIPSFFNIEFPLDYALIAPFYTNVDTRAAGTISYYQTNSQSVLQRASQNVRDSFTEESDFQATNVLVVTWLGVGYYNKKADKTNTYQVAITTDGAKTFVEFLYPHDGIQWIQGTGDESGLPDARAQAGFVSADGKVFTLPGSGTEQVRNLEKWSNINLSGQFLYRVDDEDVIEPDVTGGKSSSPVSCAEAPTSCHSQASCVDYSEGFCCQCRQQYYGNGKFCVKKDVPLRVNGKINGQINGEQLNNLDLQSYIVTVDARAYTAISKIPESIGYDIQTLQILGGVIGYVFAKPIRNALNGYQLTGGVFNYTATLNFLNTSETIIVKQRFVGLDVFDQLRLEADIQGELPNLPIGSKVIVDEYQEQYTSTAPGVIQTSSTRTFKYTTPDNQEIPQAYSIEQVFIFDYCKFQNTSVGETWKLKVGKNFISYEAKEQIIRFGLSNKITPLGDVDPCEEGRQKCGPNSACVVDNDSYRCVCNPGYQQAYNGEETVCVDLDECQLERHNCDYNAQCHNQIGTYSCTCNPGFEGDGQVCTNAMSCHRVTCTENAECVEFNRVAMCRCLPGFTGDGHTCTAIIDHSCHTINNCAKFAICTINRESNQYYCTCLPGYEGDGYTCNKIPEAENVTESPVVKDVQRCLLGVCWCPEGTVIEQGTSYCIPADATTLVPPEAPLTTEPVEAPEVQCFNSTVCFCPKGFDYNRPSNSCKIGANSESASTKGFSGFSPTCNVLNNCHRDAQCLQTPDSDVFTCRCNEGFDGDGYSCQPSIISCTQVNNCDPHAACTYDPSLGKSRCICNPGFEGDGTTCTIVAICTSNDDCTATEECLLSSSQRYECVCREDHVRDTQHQCVRQDFTCGGGNCVDNAECLFDDELQIYYCACQANYEGNGIVECRPKLVSCDVLNNCGVHALCDYNHTTAQFRCKCESGFFGDGFVCNAEITCHVDPTLCDPQATCATDADRKYTCQCNNGYIGNGTFCKQIPDHEGDFLLLNQGIATLKIPFEPDRKNLGKPIQIKLYQTAVGLDVDCLEGRLYWGDITGMGIRSASYNGSDKSDFITKGIGSPEGVSIDWVSRNIYWTDSTKDTIEVASLEGKRRRVLFDTNLVNPRGIAVHPQRGKIFWTDWDRRNPKIEWANADGTGRQIFLQGEAVSLPNSLAIDFDTEQLCYADAGTKKIECFEIDNRSRHTIATNCTYPFGITVTDRHIYWSDWISKKIERVDKASLERLPALQVPLGGSGNKLYEIIAVPKKCPELTNVCQYYKNQCPVDHICLPDGTGSRRCVCTYNAEDPSATPACTL